MNGCRVMVLLLLLSQRSRSHHRLPPRLSKRIPIRSRCDRALRPFTIVSHIALLTPRSRIRIPSDLAFLSIDLVGWRQLSRGRRCGSRLDRRRSDGSSFERRSGRGGMAGRLGDVALRWRWRSFPDRSDGFAVGHGGRKASKVRVKGEREREGQSTERRRPRAVRRDSHRGDSRQTTRPTG